MIWLTWRQFRTQATVVYAALALLAVVLAVTGPQLAGLYASTGDDLFGRITGADQSVYYLGLVTVLLVPAVIGMFWGAPLITREMETGTYRLAWNQSITRTRWLATKLVLTGVTTMAAATLATYAAFQIAVPLWVRPQLAPSVDATLSFTQAKPVNIGIGAVREVDFGQPGAWILSEQTVDATGRTAAVPESLTDCSSMSGCAANLTKAGYWQQVSYQPAGNFWTLQWVETGLYLLLALALTGFCAWWIRRRLT